MTVTACHAVEVLGQPLGVTPTELARQLHVPANLVTHLQNGQWAVTDDSALSFARWLDEAAEQRMALQARYDREIAKTEVGREIADLPTQSPLQRITSKTADDARAREEHLMRWNRTGEAIVA